MGKSTRKTYSKEFKFNAVKMITVQGNRVTEVARDIGVSETLLHVWKRKYLEDKSEAFPGHGNLKSKDAYIHKLEKENKRLKDERDILKKATIFFAKES